MQINVRWAKQEDTKAIHDLIRELAIFEEAENEHTASTAELHTALFGEHKFAFCLLAILENNIVGISLFYFKYSTWKGKTLYLEDIVVKKSNRRMGIGALLFKETIRFAIENKTGRMDWQVLDWNENAIKFYQKFGAQLNGSWVNGSFTPDQMKKALTS